jgi:hypothetical protein
MGGNESFEAGVAGNGEFSGLEGVTIAGEGVRWTGLKSLLGGGTGSAFENLERPRPGVSGIESMIKNYENS